MILLAVAFSDNLAEALRKDSLLVVLLTWCPSSIKSWPGQRPKALEAFYVALGFFVKHKCIIFKYPFFPVLFFSPPFGINRKAIISYLVPELCILISGEKNLLNREINWITVSMWFFVKLWIKHIKSYSFQYLAVQEGRIFTQGEFCILLKAWQECQCS